MNPKIEDLRKKAYVLYGGLEGVQRVQKEVKKMGVKEDKLNQMQQKVVLNNIIKNVFIDYVGLEKSKDILAKDVGHVPGYHRTVEEEEEHVHIFERIHFMKWFMIGFVLLIIAFIVGTGYYALSFDKAQSCHKRASVAARDTCYMTVALSSLNASACENLSTQKLRYNCYGQVGMKSNSLDTCNMIPADDVSILGIHDKCITCVAYALDNKSICNEFLNHIKKSECEAQIERGYSLICEGNA